MPPPSVPNSDLPPKAGDETTISLFSYPDNPALPGLLDSWAASPTPIRVLQPGSSEPARTTGSLSLDPLPFLPQARYDELLWTCDLNFVRGEDSFVRAQWAAKPFVWQIYPQAEDAHLVKLDAFLARHPAGEQHAPLLACMERCRRSRLAGLCHVPAGPCRPDAAMGRNPRRPPRSRRRACAFLP
jgi:uncharacterized repeat protein (TIGR03837 family)